MNYFLLFRDTYMLYMENPPAQVYMLQHFMNSNFYKLNYQRLGTAAFLVVLTLPALICGILFVQRRVKRQVGERETILVSACCTGSDCPVLPVAYDLSAVRLPGRSGRCVPV